MSPFGWILTASQQRALDTATIASGVPEQTLMESAGRQAAAWILENVSPTRVVVLAGPGGNGGDAFVVAHQLLLAGTAVRVFVWRDPAAAAPLTRRMGERLRTLGISFTLLSAAGDSLAAEVAACDVIVDGLWGSGLSRPLPDDLRSLTQTLNESARRTVSLDVPSGVASDSGSVSGPAVRADVTLAMGATKPCHWLYPAAAFCGRVECITLAYPSAELRKVVPLALVTDRRAVAARLPVRRPNGHKGTFGHVLVIAGSQGMSGAPVLCARGALRAGAGRVTAVIPQTIATAVQSAVPEALTLPLPDEDGRLVDPRTADRLHQTIEQTDAVAIGPGLGRDPRTMEWVRRVLSVCPVPMVVDADALYALIQNRALLAELTDRAVLTPHPGEMAALVGSTASEIDAERLTAAAWPTSRCATALLKGRPTVVRRSDGRLLVNPTGNTGLATGGSGDVLTGLLAGFVAGGVHLDDAAWIAPYVHGAAADRWSRSRAERSMTPTDLLEEIPYVLKELAL